MAKPIAVFTFIFAAYAFTAQQRECKSDPQTNKPRFVRRRSMKRSRSTESGQTAKFEHAEKTKSKKDGDGQRTSPDSSQPEQ